jgi:hypothetical protein
MIINVHRSPCKAPVILADFNFLKKIEFSRRIFEKFSNIKFHENPYGRTDGETGMAKLIVPFRSCANAPKNMTLG